MSQTLYEQDLYAWTLENVALLRQGRLDEIDVNNIIEELEYMSRKDKDELINRLAILLMHLLKWQFQAAKRSLSWQYTIKEQRRKVARLLKESPSLWYELDLKLAEAYEDGVIKAVKETNLLPDTFPSTCPYTLEQALDDDFYPESEVLT